MYPSPDTQTVWSHSLELSPLPTGDSSEFRWVIFDRQRITSFSNYGGGGGGGGEFCTLIFPGNGDKNVGRGRSGYETLVGSRMSFFRLVPVLNINILITLIYVL